MPTIPAIIADVSDPNSVEQALIENLHRQDLNPLEEAGAYQQLIEDFGLTHEQLSVRVGKSRAAITNTLRLFQLPPAVQKMVADGQLSAGHARALLGTPDRAFQEALARRAVAEQLSVRAVEEAVETRNELEDRPRRSSPGRKLRPPGMLELEDLLSQPSRHPGQGPVWARKRGGWTSTSPPWRTSSGSTAHDRGPLRPE